MNEKIKIRKCIIDDIIIHARDEYPNEMCGLLVGINDGLGTTSIANYHRITNDNPGPMSFMLNSKEMMRVHKNSRKSGMNEIVIVHSHPKGPSRLSSTDKSMAYDKTRLWFLVSMIDDQNIMLQCWRVENSGVSIEDVEIEIS